MEKLKIGLFGIGHNHATAAITTLKARPDVEIVGLYEPSHEMLAKKLAEAPSLYGDIPVMTVGQLLDCGITAAMVEASVPELVGMATLCAERGLHVHMDKPAGTDLAAYKRFLDIAEQKKLVFQTGYMYRYNAGVRYLLDKVRSGDLGRVYNVTATMSTKHPQWFKRQLVGYNVKSPDMFIFGGHLIDLVLQVKGSPKSIAHFEGRSGNDGIDFADTALAVLAYDDGIATVKASSVEVNGWGLREFTVYGENGTISISPIENPMKIKETTLSEQEPWKDRYREISIAEEGRYDVMMQEFVQMITGQIPHDVDFRHEYLLQKLTLEACGYDVED